MRSSGPKDPISDVLCRGEFLTDRGTQTHATGFLEALGYPPGICCPTTVRQALQDPRLDDDHKHFVYMKFMNSVDQKVRVAIKTAGLAYC